VINQKAGQAHEHDQLPDASLCVRLAATIGHFLWQGGRLPAGDPGGSGAATIVAQAGMPFSAAC